MGDDAKGCIAAVLVVFICASAGFLIGFSTDPGRDVRKAAVEAGVAHWTVDEKTGKSQFEWITKGAEQP